MVRTGLWPVLSRVNRSEDRCWVSLNALTEVSPFSLRTGSETAHPATAIINNCAALQQSWAKPCFDFIGRLTLEKPP